jgi:hypothetical protein
MVLTLAGMACTPRSGSYPEDPGYAQDLHGEGALDDTAADAVAADADVDSPDADVPAAEVHDPVPHRGMCMPNDAPFPVRPAVTEQPTLPAIHVQGRGIVTPDGTAVALRGTNFGAWLQAETWISGLGLVYEDELFDAMPAKADQFGVRDLFDIGWNGFAGEWLLGLRSEGPLVDDLRASMYANATEEREGAIDAFWNWFDSVPWAFDEQSLWEGFGRRFGWAKSMELREAFANVWITEEDVRLVARMGLNLIRVPVWYDALETDLAEGGNGFRPEGWKHLDDVARWARKYHVYVMIDLHGAPGGQSVASHQGTRDGGHLWTEPACKTKTARLWKALAAYFDGDPHVAVLDLLNEPMSMESVAQYRDVHDAIYTAIREADTDASFIVMAEDGYKPGSYIASPREMGWTNAMFSIHLYPDGPSSAAEYVEQMQTELRLADARLGDATGRFMTRFDCPLFVGEFAAGGTASWCPDAMDKTLALLNSRGVHWAPWTWKYRAKNDCWGVLQPPVAVEQRLDIGKSFDEVLADFAKLDTKTWVEFGAFGDALWTRSQEAVAPLNLSDAIP